MMKTLLIVCALAAVLPAQAVDMPQARPEPSATDRLSKVRLALSNKDWSFAQRELQAGVRAEPNNADMHNLLAYTYRKRPGPDITKAFEHYYIALRIDPKHKGAHEYIGQAYLMEKRLPEAEKHLAELEKLCGNTTCAEYQELAKAIGEFKAAAK
jgi:Tfp pilus assembly protein PilF